MAYSTDSAPDFVQKVLAERPELEWQVADLHAACSGKWTKGNINNALDRLHRKGLVTRTVDPDRSAWWSIAE